MVTTPPHPSDAADHAAEPAWPVLSCRHTCVEAGAPHEGWLILADGKLVAALVCLDAVENGEHGYGGAWHLEADFGRLAGARTEPFPTVADALDWTRERLSQGAA